MTARQPRRRRRAVPAAALPRPSGATTAHDMAEDAPDVASDSARGARRHTPARREHHVTTDYSYVRKELVLISAVGLLSLAFVFAMYFVV